MPNALNPVAAPRRFPGPWLRGLERFLWESRAGSAACALIFFATTVAVGKVYLHDEGLYTFDVARFMNEEFAAFFFWPKGKPVLLLLYALPAELGLDAFLVAHCLVGAAAILLVNATARRLGIAHPNLAGWMLATSTIFAITVSNGVPNADGAAFLALFLFLYFSGNYRWAAPVAGLLPFVRYELALVAFAFFAWDLWRRRDVRFAAGALVLPAAYLFAGAVYHREPAWVAELWVNPGLMPRELMLWPESLRLWRSFHPDAVADFHRTSFLYNSPVLAVFALFGAVLAVLRRDARALILAGLVATFLTSISLFQLTAVVPVGLTLRGHVALLPAVALLVAWGISGLPTLPRLWSPLSPESSARLHLALRFVLVAAAVAHQGWRLENRGEEAARHRRTHELVAELRERGIYTGQPVFTDLYEARFDQCAGLGEVGFLVNGSITWELRTGSTVASGQREAIWRAQVSRGWHLDPESHEVRRDALYVLEDHSRVASWQQRVDAAEPTRLRTHGFVVSYWPESP